MAINPVCVCFSVYAIISMLLNELYCGISIKVDCALTTQYFFNAEINNR